MWNWSARQKENSQGYRRYPVPRLAHQSRSPLGQELVEQAVGFRWC